MQISGINGEGEVVAGIVVMRFGENALKVIERVKAKIAEIEPGLPEGVRIRSAYDRSGLIHRSIDTLKHTLSHELAITAMICLIFLLHVRSGLVAAAVLPLGILMSFIVMKWYGITADGWTIMSTTLMHHHEYYPELCRTSGLTNTKHARPVRS